MRCDLVGTSALVLAFVASVGLAAAQQQPPPNASPPAPSYVEHGGLLPRLAPTPDTRRRWRSAVGLPRTQGITEGTAGPWVV